MAYLRNIPRSGGHTRAVDGVRDGHIDWIRHESALAETLSYAIPDLYEACGVLNLPHDIGAVEDGLLDALTAGPTDVLIAGWIDRGP